MPQFDFHGICSNSMAKVLARDFSKFIQIYLQIVSDELIDTYTDVMFTVCMLEKHQERKASPSDTAES